MITLSGEKLMQHMLLGVHEVTEQCVVVVLDELCCRWPVSRVDTSPDSMTDDSFDAMSIICRREAPPGTGRVEQFDENDDLLLVLDVTRGCVSSLNGHALSWKFSTGQMLRH